MHEILPGALWLGNQFSVGFPEAMTGIVPRCALKMLKERHITHILCVIDKTPLFTNVGLKYLTIPMSDSSSFDLIGCLSRTNAFLSNAIKDGGIVLVHCQMGQSRSSAVVIAFLMFSKGWSFDVAYQHVKLCRSFINPVRFRPQLLRYEEGLSNATKRHPVLHEE